MTACLFGTYDQRPQREPAAAPRARPTPGFDGRGAARAALGGHARQGRVATSRAASLGRPRRAAGPAAAAPAGRALARGRGGPPPLVVVGFGGQLDVLLAARVCRPRARARLRAAGEPDRDAGGGSRACSPPAACARAAGRRRSTARRLRAADLVLADTDGARRLPARARRAGATAWPRGTSASSRSSSPRSRGAVVAAARAVLRALPAAARHRHDPRGRGAARRSRRRRAHRRRSRAAAHGGAGGAARVRASRGATRCRSAALPGELARGGGGARASSAPAAKAAMVVPNKVYQAAAAGRPLVTRDGPALREVLEPGAHCLVCPPGDPDALAAAVARLLDDPALGGAPGRCGARPRAASGSARRRWPARLARRAGGAPRRAPGSERRERAYRGRRRHLGGRGGHRALRRIAARAGSRRPTRWSSSTTRRARRSGRGCAPASAREHGRPAAAARRQPAVRRRPQRRRRARRSPRAPTPCCC